jgi:hypothetical protein
MTQLDPIYWQDKNGDNANPAASKEGEALLAKDPNLFYLFVRFVQAVRDDTDNARAEGNDADKIWWHGKLSLAGAQWGDIIRARIKEATPDKRERAKLVELLAKALAAAGVQQPQVDALKARLDGGTLDRDDFTQGE